MHYNKLFDNFNKKQLGKYSIKQTFDLPVRLDPNIEYRLKVAREKKVSQSHNQPQLAALSQNPS